MALTRTSAKRVLLWNVMVRLAYVTKAAFWLPALYHNNYDQSRIVKICICRKLHFTAVIATLLYKYLMIYHINSISCYYYFNAIIVRTESYYQQILKLVSQAWYNFVVPVLISFVPFPLPSLHSPITFSYFSLSYYF